MTAAAFPSSRLAVGHIVSPFEVETLSHGVLRVPQPTRVHLQFRRFAGCPICNLHMREFAKKLSLLEAAKVQTVAFFHSSAEVMRPFQGDLPFPVVADPERHWYKRFAVERSAVAAFHPKALIAVMKGMVLARSNPIKGEGGHNGLPADFLIGTDGRVLAAHYGKHADDHWEVEEIVALATAQRLSASTT